MWGYESVFYQIYPMGFCGAPFENDGKLEHRIKKVIDWIPHIQKLGCNAIYFSPVFESDTHGYNTRDYRKLDVRLGTNDDFKEVVEKLHEAGIRVVVDGVFNHVGRGFFAFQDVLKNRQASRYCSWFYLSFDGNSCYNDGLWYEGWEGNFDLVKLNLDNEEVVTYLLESVKFWVEELGIDGIRLDVAYMVNRNFLRRIRRMCEENAGQWGKEIFLIGEMIHGDYREIVNDEMLHSATNYECYKGLYSSFNSMNMFEINHSLMRQFGEDGQGIYRGMQLFSFVDNHDVTRVASILQNKNHLPLIYALLMGMPGIPCIYYGSEWGEKADKSQGDPALRPCFENPVENELFDEIRKFIQLRTVHKALSMGSFRNVFLTNKQCAIERKYGDEVVWVLINAEENPFTVYMQTDCSQAVDLLTEEEQDCRNGIAMSPYSTKFLKKL